MTAEVQVSTPRSKAWWVERLQANESVPESAWIGIKNFKELKEFANGCGIVPSKEDWGNQFSKAPVQFPESVDIHSEYDTAREPLISGAQRNQAPPAYPTTKQQNPQMKPPPAFVFPPNAFPDIQRQPVPTLSRKSSMKAPKPATEIKASLPVDAKHTRHEELPKTKALSVEDLKELELRKMKLKIDAMMKLFQEL